MSSAAQPSTPDADLSPDAGDPEERIARLTGILETTKHLAAEKDLHRLLNLIIHQARNTAHCEQASVFLYDEAHNQLYTYTLTNPQEVSEIRLPADQGIVGLVAREQRMVHVADPYSHPLFRPDFDRRTGFRTRNILAAPLISWTDGKLLGVVYLLNKQGGQFTTADAQMLELFGSHAAIALERALLARHYEEKVQLLASLKLAHEIQASFFPRKMPRLPGYTVAGSSRPSEATGGDYFDVIPLGPDRCGLVVADVCGHGLGPSLLMASLRALLRAFAPKAASPEALVSDLGEALYDDLGARHRFITLLYGVLVPSEHRFYYANAGHGPVVLHLQAEAGRVDPLVDPARGCPLGIIKEKYEGCAPVELGPGDLLVLGSDGLAETRRDGEQFGIGRLGDFLLQNPGRPLDGLIGEVFEAADAFRGSPNPEDDVTLLLVRREA